jgi:hypothetical protein
VSARSAPPSPPADGRRRIAAAAWLYVGIAGLSALACGVRALADGTGAWSSALPLILAGGALAAVAWSRARTVLEDVGGRGAAAARRHATMPRTLGDTRGKARAS